MKKLGELFMSRPRKNIKNNSKTENNLLSALRFTSLITKEVGAPYETHVYLKDNWATAFNGVVSCGHRIEEPLFACPHNHLMLQALSKCGDAISIEQAETRLAIKSGKFKAFIPCLDPALLQIGIPDAPVAIIDDRLKLALETVAVLANESATKVYLVSVLLNGYSVIGTNGVVIFECWHGIHLPSNISIPKSVVQVLSKIQNKLSKFGFSQSSVTFYFEDDSWIKSQLFSDEWPNIAGILDRPSNQWPLPADLWKGLEAVAPFSQNGTIFFDAGCLRSHAETGVGASFAIEGLPRGPIFAAKQLGLLKGLAETADWFAPGPHPGTTMLMFQGKDIRGALMGRES